MQGRSISSIAYAICYTIIAKCDAYPDASSLANTPPQTVDYDERTLSLFLALFNIVVVKAFSALSSSFHYSMTYDLEQLQLVTIEILLRRWLLLGGGRIFGADLRIISENCEDKFRAEQGSASRTLCEQGALTSNSYWRSGPQASIRLEHMHGAPESSRWRY